MASIPDILQQHDVTTAGPSHHHVSTGWLGVDCKSCSPASGRYRLGFEVATGRCNCWHCGPQNTITALASVCDVSYEKIKELLAGFAFQKRKIEEHTGSLQFPYGVGPMQPIHKAYLRGRGFDPNAIARLWGVRGICVAPYGMSWRLFIPIRLPSGTTVSWTSRAIGNTDRQRYMSAATADEAVPHKTLLYGAELARHAVVVTEGPFDAWAIGPGGVATCGIGYSQRQLEAVAEYPLRVICFDNSNDAQRRAARLMGELTGVPGETVLARLESGEDPATADPAELDEIRAIIA